MQAAGFRTDATCDLYEPPARVAPNSPRFAAAVSLPEITKSRTQFWGSHNFGKTFFSRQI